MAVFLQVVWVGDPQRVSMLPIIHNNNTNNNKQWHAIALHNISLCLSTKRLCDASMRGAGNAIIEEPTAVGTYTNQSWFMNGCA